ncbi:hypothetical protein Tco_0616087 [Tanacetum coccineum]
MYKDSNTLCHTTSNIVSKRNGDNTSFWKDKWHNEGVLKDVFPRLYALERHQNVTIHTKLIDYSLVNSFRRNPRSGVEEFQLDNLSRLVSTITLSSAVDRYVWSLENSGEFSVKSIRQVIDANCFPVIHSATRWVKSVPLKVNIMAWKIKMDGLPTRMNISRRDSWLGKYRLGGMWITLMFLLMRNDTLGWYLLGFRQISKRCSKASSIVYDGRFGCSQEAGGSSDGPKRRRTYIFREREEAEQRLIDDYFGDDEYEPKYPEEKFRRRYFRVRIDAISRNSIGPILKCTPAIRQMAYGTAPDAFDEYLQIAELTDKEPTLDEDKHSSIFDKDTLWSILWNDDDE